MIGLVLCIVFSKIFAINELFLAVVVSSLAAIPIALSARKDSLTTVSTIPADRKPDGIFGMRLSEIRTVIKDHWGLLFLTFFVGITGTVGSFIIPISEYKGGGDLTAIILLSLALGAPSLLSYALGKMADKFGLKALVAAMLIQTALLLLVGRTVHYAVVFGLTFCLSLMDNLIYFSIAEMSANKSHKENYGKLSTLLIAAGSVGALAGPILLGVLIDMKDIHFAMLVLAAASLLVLMKLFFEVSNSRSKKLA
jgi:MFS family permease